MTDVLAYMEQYSQSMPQAIPSLTLALSELADRNGVFYRPGQLCHEQLLVRHLQSDGGTEVDLNAVTKQMLLAKRKHDALQK